VIKQYKCEFCTMRDSMVMRGFQKCTCKDEKSIEGKEIERGNEVVGEGEKRKMSW
jgi:hypothetical protein